MRAQPVMTRRGQDAGGGQLHPAHRPQLREHLRPAGLARRQGGAHPRQLHRGQARLPAHLRRGERQRHRPVRGRQHRRSTSPASRASTAGSTTTPATSSSSSSITYCIEWVLRWMYFHDWRGALRPTITGLIAAFWGLGFIYLIGLALDPLMLVMPFLITARAVSHAIQMHDRYYEEFEKSRLAQAAGHRRVVRRAVRADVLGHHHRRVRRARHPARAGDHAAEARDHRVVVDPRDHRLRDAAQPDRLLLPEGAGAGAGDAARARRLPQADQPLRRRAC